MSLQSNSHQAGDNTKGSHTPVYLNTAQAADFITRKGLQITKGQLSNLRHFNKGPKYIKFNSYIYYTPEDLNAWLAQEVRRISPEG